jgi:hypothetical protein
MTEHVMTRETGGEGMSYSIRPTCSCGWRGEAHQAWEDWQHTLVGEQEGKHRQAVKEQQDD